MIITTRILGFDIVFFATHVLPHPCRYVVSQHWLTTRQTATRCVGCQGDPSPSYSKVVVSKSNFLKSPRTHTSQSLTSHLHPLVKSLTWQLCFLLQWMVLSDRTKISFWNVYPRSLRGWQLYVCTWDDQTKVVESNVCSPGDHITYWCWLILSSARFTARWAA